MYYQSHDCIEYGHSWIFIGCSDGRPRYRCRFCLLESDDE